MRSAAIRMQRNRRGRNGCRFRRLGDGHQLEYGRTLRDQRDLGNGGHIGNGRELRLGRHRRIDRRIECRRGVRCDRSPHAVRPTPPPVRDSARANRARTQRARQHRSPARSARLGVPGVSRARPPPHPQGDPPARARGAEPAGAFGSSAPSPATAFARQARSPIDRANASVNRPTRRCGDRLGEGRRDPGSRCLALSLGLRPTHERTGSRTAAVPPAGLSVQSLLLVRARFLGGHRLCLTAPVSFVTQAASAADARDRRGSAARAEGSRADDRPRGCPGDQRRPAARVTPPPLRPGP